MAVEWISLGILLQNLIRLANIICAEGRRLFGEARQDVYLCKNIYLYIRITARKECQILVASE